MTNELRRQQALNKSSASLLTKLFKKAVQEKDLKI